VVICPNCRHDNLEDATVCAKCGASLDPGVSRLLPVRRTEAERPAFELHTPKPPSVWRPVAIFGLFALFAGGIGVYYLVRPNPCDGTNFTSTNFGYCVLVPDGWEAGPARFGSDVTLDQFAPPTASTTVIVSSVDLDAGVTLSDFSDFVRQRDDTAGLTPGPTSDTTLDGVDAIQWDVTVETEGETYRMREVVTVRDDVGWRITLNDVRQGFATSAVAFRDLLDSWQFR
jgi:zinc-ribbon domain